MLCYHIPWNPTLMRWTRLLPALLIIAAIAAAYASGVHRSLSWAALAEQQAALLAMVGARPLVMAAGYIGAYALAVALSLPGAVVLTVAGGLLFGTIAGAALAVIGATLGAVLVFLAARSALGPLLAARAGPLLERLRPRLQRDGFSYMLVLRLVPAFPFFAVNLVAALAGMPLGVYTLATLIGIIPGTTVFASIGAGISGVLAAGGTPDVGIIFSWQVLLPLLGLAALSLLPILLRRTRNA